MLEIKSDRLFSATSSLIISIVLIIIGIFLISFKGVLYYQLVQIFTLAILFLSIKQFVNFFLGKNKEKNINFAKCFLNLICHSDQTRTLFECVEESHGVPARTCFAAG